MPAIAQAWQPQYGLAKETTPGTGVAPTDFLPLSSPHFIDKPVVLKDQGYRGLAAATYAVNQGKIHGEISGSTVFYPGSTGHLLMAILGTDTISGAGPYTHALKMATVLPPTYTMYAYDTAAASTQARSFTNCYVSDVSLKYSANAALMVDMKAIGKKSVLVAKTTATYPTTSMLLGWQGALTLNSVANARLTDATIDLKRTVTPIGGSSGTQSVDFFSVETLSVTGKMTFVVTDETDLLLFLNDTQPTFSLLFTNGANTVTMTMTKQALMDPTEVDRSTGYLKLSASFEAVYNTTDAGPMQFSLVDTKAVAY